MQYNQFLLPAWCFWLLQHTATALRALVSQQQQEKQQLVQQGLMEQQRMQLPRQMVGRNSSRWEWLLACFLKH
jgi:hypothetical protein